MPKVESWQLWQRQKMPLDIKIRYSEERIRSWYDHFGGCVYVSFSGGKDSVVLLHLVRKLYPNVVGVFVDTGLEYPEIRKFVKDTDNIVWLRPARSFSQVLEKFGYPVISKDVSQKVYEIRNTKSDKLRNKRLYGDDKGYGKLSNKWRFLVDAEFKISHDCCRIMKKNPCKKFERESGLRPFIGTMACNSANRTTTYLRTGCNSFESSRPLSVPISFWLEEDIWEYIRKYELKYSEIYDTGIKNTGCMYYMFGIHMEAEPNRFQRMKNTHPKQYDYCIDKLGCGKVLDFLDIKY